MNTEQLATLERQWLLKQRGLLGDKDRLYEQAGVYAAWREIFGWYATLAREGDGEALKRALYLLWAEHSIGPLMTGLKDLDRETIREVLGLADQLAADSQLDVELDWMLPYYYIVDRPYLDRFEGLDALKRFSGQHPFLYRQRCLDSAFDGRGQMGEYWRTEQTYLRRWS